MAKKLTCFVISPIGETGTPTRARADKVYKYILQEVLEPAGYELTRADKLAEPGVITNQIIDRVINSDLVVADLSERNPNVFYELAVRHVAKKPFIHLIASDEDIPFDNAAVRAIKVDVTDLDSVAEAKAELAAQVEAVSRPNARVDSPISVAININELRGSDDSEKVVVATLLEKMSQLQEAVSAIDARTRGNVGATVYAPALSNAPTPSHLRLADLVPTSEQVSSFPASKLGQLLTEQATQRPPTGMIGKPRRSKF